jgi:hypothetical protein
VAFTKVLTMYQLCIVISYSNSPFPHSAVSPPTPIHGIVTVGIIIALTCMCTHFLHCIHPPTLFPHHLPLPVVLFPSRNYKGGLEPCSLYQVTNAWIQISYLVMAVGYSKVILRSMFSYLNLSFFSSLSRPSPFSSFQCITVSTPQVQV